jgi:phosphatidylglycerophosphate synthase
MKKLIAIPTFISSLRMAVLPLFIYVYSPANIAPCLILLAFSAGTDFFDGYFARKLGVTSRFGAYYDATTDFTLVIGIFAFFSTTGYYPIWLLLVIAASFVQFLITSHYTKRLYDPIGKYIGSALYIGIILTLVFPTQATYSFVLFAFVGFFLVSLGSRITSLLRN